MPVMLIGFISALSIFILLWKINLEWFVRYHWQTDVVFTLLATWVYFGTFSGMVTAVVAGVFFSGMLYISKLILDI